MERDSKVSKRLGGKKRFFSDRRSAIGDSSLSLSLSLLVEPAGKMLGEAGLEKCGTR